MVFFSSLIWNTFLCLLILFIFLCLSDRWKVLCSRLEGVSLQECPYAVCVYPVGLLGELYLLWAWVFPWVSLRSGQMVQSPRLFSVCRLCRKLIILSSSWSEAESGLSSSLCVCILLGKAPPAGGEMHQNKNGWSRGHAAWGVLWCAGGNWPEPQAISICCPHHVPSY